VATELRTINDIFEDISITFEVGEPKEVEVDGMLTIVQTERSIVNYTNEQMKAIIEQSEIVRNKLTQ